MTAALIVAALAAAFAAGWYAGRYRLGSRQLPALTRALFGAERAAALAIELRECIEDAPLSGREFSGSHACNELGEIARQARSVADWVHWQRWPRPLGVKHWEPQSPFPFRRTERRARMSPEVPHEEQGR